MPPPVKLSDKETLEVLRFGALKHAQGKFDEADTAFRQVLARDPNNVDAFYNLGSLAERRGDLIAALSHYRAAQALKPSDHQISVAVRSVEKTLRNAPFANNYLHPNFAAPVGEIPLAQANQFPYPPLAPASGANYAGNMPGAAVGKGSAGQSVSDGNGDDKRRGTNGDTPVLNVSSDNGPDPVPSVTGLPGGGTGAGTFQLSSSQNTALPPTLGVVPLAGAALPTPPPVVGVAARSHPMARAAFNGALNTGASFGLRAVGLHCPVCHFLRFNF